MFIIKENDENSSIEYTGVYDFSGLIPEKYVGRNPACVFVTTYSLDIPILYSTMDKILKGNLHDHIKNKSLYVFYNRTKIEEHNPDCFGNCLHEINIKKSFHPKLILLKYVSNDSSDYVIIISSKNISKSKLVEAYAVAVGSVSKEKKQEKNGNSLLNFFNSFCNIEVLDDLKYTDFNLVDPEKNSVVENSLQFLQAGDVNKKLLVAKLQIDCPLLIVSPFFKKFWKDPDFEKIMEKCSIFKDENVHAKIYCWKNENNNTQWIIGSSNATYNGMNNNIELNIAFETKGPDYDSFYKMLQEQMQPFAKVITDSGDNRINDLIKSIELSTKSEDDKYECCVRFTDNDIETIIRNLNNIKITINIENSNDCSTKSKCIFLNIDEIRKFSISTESSKSFPFITLHFIIEPENNLDNIIESITKTVTFKVDWKDERIMDDLHRRAIDELENIITKRLIYKKRNLFDNGRKNSSVQSPTNNKKRTYQSPFYCYERIMDDVLTIKRDDPEGDIEEKFKDHINELWENIPDDPQLKILKDYKKLISDIRNELQKENDINVN